MNNSVNAEPSDEEIIIIPAALSHEWRVSECPLVITSFQVSIEVVEPSGYEFLKVFNDKITSNGYLFPVTQPLRELEESLWREAGHSISQALSVAILRFQIRLFFLCLLEEHFGEEIEQVEQSFSDEFGSKDDGFDLAVAIEVFIKSNVGQSLQLEDVASHFHFSTRHLNRVFKSRFGCPIGTFIRNVKIETACGYLKNTDRSIKDIAFSLGYKDVGYFCRHFSKCMNMTPSQFRGKDTLPKPLM